ncbi:hypothetical protein D9598_09315 [Roseomonas sp. KE0001]|nr:hypothetical protein [Roseomonas sp. KE0001]
MSLAQMDLIDQALASVRRLINERALLSEVFSSEAFGRGDKVLGSRWAELRREMELKSEILRRLLEHGWG